jgi:hypothetical protein
MHLKNVIQRKRNYHILRGGGRCINHSQLVRYEKDGPELYRYGQNNNILKTNLCKKMGLRALNSI